ncbi:MAG TPA: acylphosphatase [Sphingomicrobium sp.]|jgi:acylphosphatase|nr:acylphosphatase [Sphingomicrobium sp.]
MLARRVRITGLVQGVFFRAWTREEAQRLGLTGWVRNCADGSVEAHIEGDPGMVRWMIDKLAYGPKGARVDGCEARDVEPENLKAFEIRP